MSDLIDPGAYVVRQTRRKVRGLKLNATHYTTPKLVAKAVWESLAEDGNTGGVLWVELDGKRYDHRGNEVTA